MALSAHARLRPQRLVPDLIGPMIGPGMFAVAAILLFLETAGIPADKTSQSVGPTFWPKMALAGMFLGAVIKCSEISWAYRHREKRRSPVVEDPPAVAPTAPAKAMLVIGLCILAVLMMEMIGFALANFLFLTIFLPVAGMRSKVRSLFVGLGGTLAILYFFLKVLYVPFPRGVGIFDGITVSLYRLLGIF